MKIDLNSRMVYSINGMVYRAWMDSNDTMHFVTDRRHTTVAGWVGADYDMICDIIESIENGDNVQILDLCIDFATMQDNGYFDDIEPKLATKFGRLVNRAVQDKNERTATCLDNIIRINSEW